MSEKTDARFHTAGDDSDGCACASAWALFWISETEITEEAHARRARASFERYKVAWEAATRHQGVDGVHPRQAREKAP